METDNTQSAEQTPDGSNVNTNTQPPAVPPGVQARIDELTAQFRSAQQTINQQQQAMAELMAAQAAQLRQAPQPQQPQAPVIQLPEGTDPAIAQAFNALSTGFQNQLLESQKRIEALVGQSVGQVRQSQETMELQAMLSKERPEVADMATKLLNDWRRQGFTGFVAKDAVIYARGALGAQAPTQTHQTAEPTTMMTGTSTPNPVKGQLPPPPPPEVMSKWTPAAQEQYWAKRLAAQGGHVDQEIVY